MSGQPIMPKKPCFGCSRRTGGKDEAHQSVSYTVAHARIWFDVDGDRVAARVGR